MSYIDIFLPYGGKMGRIWQHKICLGLLLIFPNLAFGGAWIPREGKTELIASINTVGNDENHGTAFEYYAARGLSADSALIFSQNIKLYKNFPAISKTDFKLQFKLLQGHGLILSSQFGISTIDSVQINYRENNSIYNMLLGYGFGRNWLNLEYGREGCLGEYQRTSEITFGSHIYKKDLLILKKFQAGCDYYNDNNNFQISYIKRFNNNLGLEFGLRQSNSRAKFDNSENINQGFIISLWKRY